MFACNLRSRASEIRPSASLQARVFALLCGPSGLCRFTLVIFGGATCRELLRRARWSDVGINEKHFHSDMAASL